MSTPLAPRNTPDSIAWFHEERRLDHRYPGECLILQRSGRGIPPLAPTAHAAQVITPTRERVYKLENLRRGMIGYTFGSNPAGHVFDILGRKKGFDLDDPDGILTLTNDADEEAPGAIRVVALSFYKNQWGHEWQFGATRLNGYDFADFNAPPKVPAHLGTTYHHAIEDMKKAIAHHKAEGHDVLVAGLENDLERMQKRYHHWQ